MAINVEKTSRQFTLQMTLEPVAIFHSPFQTKFGVPRQAGVVADMPGRIVLEKQYRTADAIRGMEDFDYLWLLWGFSANKHAAAGVTVRPPRLGGNASLGVFATRSPFRPNPVGLSSVRIDHIDYDSKDGPVIHVLGADLMDGTPIYDIKPYVPYTDAHPEARGGFTDNTQWQPLKVDIPADIAARFTADKLRILRATLEQDPRPHYHADPQRIYGMPFDGEDIRFRVEDGTLHVVEVTDIAR